MVPASRMSFCYGNYEIITGDIKSDLYYFCMQQDGNDNWIHLHGNKIEREGFITSNKKTKNNIGILLPKLFRSTVRKNSFICLRKKLQKGDTK